ncbi:hypothetical protein [Portibacter lacus]|uniref:Uncharacterized protein n=1 Tax=Portibacter lacus TaxID=1099794 RepID=A0AA37SNM8_9BACT|nr:hypothetical protein [Portibacter lacus]GLR16176.1 hypothetical protein GCM10007940_07910 [Portibacter lacus]
MKNIRSYVTNPEFLNKTYLDFNVALAKALDAQVNFVVHSKEIFEPSISPIIGNGLPSLQIEEIDRLRSNLKTYASARQHVKFNLSQDIFAEIFSNADADPNLILHSFSGKGADFVLHNIYTTNELDVAFDNISPAMFIPDQYHYITPKNIYILLFSEDLGSNFDPILSLAAQLGAKINFIIQQVEKDHREESILEKITLANNINLKDINFSAKFVDKIDEKLIKNLSNGAENSYWTIFQHSFLIKDLKDKTLTIDMYELLSDSDHPMIIV